MRTTLNLFSVLVMVAILALGVLGSVSAAVADDGGGGSATARQNAVFRVEIPVLIFYDSQNQNPASNTALASAVSKPATNSSTAECSRCHHRHCGSCLVRPVVQTGRAVGGVATDTVGTTFEVVGDLFKGRVDVAFSDIGDSFRKTGRRFGRIFD